jgi:beta-ureidopropionase / N-carbamoyl-L-amino-acid hydrolase
MAAPRQNSINGERLMSRLNTLGDIGSTGDGGCSRLALTDDDKHGRDLVMSWMHDLDLDVSVDAIGNVVGTWNVGRGAPVMTGSHIDTVRTGGLYDGNYGVLAGLEVIETCKELGLEPARPFSVAFFTNEEGARFAPDMLGSLVYVGGLAVEEALDTTSIDGKRLGDELQRIGYAGVSPCPGPIPHAFIELHIEQGPVLEAEGFTFGAVTGVQGISWQEITITGQSNHAGTTPMHLRRDPAFVASMLAVYLREIAERFGGDQVCTVGKIDVHPNLINVIPAKVTMTLDVRNTDEDTLQDAEQLIDTFCFQIEQDEGVSISKRSLARFEPVTFHEEMVEIIERRAHEIDERVKRMPSGAGHDAQMLARVCPSAMIFVPSRAGISHNPAEHTDEDQLVAGANVLLRAMLDAASREF